MTQALLEALRANGGEVRAALARHAPGQWVATASVDIRRSARKAAVVDTNAFPAGFNNLCKLDKPRLAEALRSHLAHWAPGTRIGLYAEALTRNPWYVESLAVLQGALASAGYAPTVVAPVAEAVDLQGAQGSRLRLAPAQRRAGPHGGVLGAPGDTGFEAFDAVLLNNDLSTGMDSLLAGLATPVQPPPQLGWWSRSKRQHFEAMDPILGDVARALGVDPWLIGTLHRGVDGVAFRSRDGLDRLADTVDAVLGDVAAKYAEHGMRDPPVAFVKADRGTFGRGVMHVSSGREVLGLDGRSRAWMAQGKQGIETTSVLVQEGVPTVHRHQGHPSEPVLYLVGAQVVGAFARVHAGKDGTESLNAPGQRFAPDCGHDNHQPGDQPVSTDGHMALYELLASCAAAALAGEARGLASRGP